jgi:hypothetical protein
MRPSKRWASWRPRSIPISTPYELNVGPQGGGRWNDFAHCTSGVPAVYQRCTSSVPTSSECSQSTACMKEATFPWSMNQATVRCSVMLLRGAPTNRQRRRQPVALTNLHLILNWCNQNPPPAYSCSCLWVGLNAAPAPMFMSVMCEPKSRGRWPRLAKALHVA